jgi:hypothetical protein
MYTKISWGRIYFKLHEQPGTNKDRLFISLRYRLEKSAMIHDGFPWWIRAIDLLRILT